jgi:putative transposase
MKCSNAKPSRTGWLYLTGILDLYRRKIWAMGPRIDTELVLNAFHMAVRHRQPPRGLLFHSDRGVQSASADYRGALGQAGRVASMSRQGNGYDNAAMESFWSTLKWELVFRRHFASRLQAQSEIFDYLEVFHNRQRSHSALNFGSPVDFELQIN